MRKELLIAPEEISERIGQVAKQLSGLAPGSPLHIVGILKGSICLLADLIRALDIPFQIDFVSASSYGMRGTASGALTLSGIDSLDLTGKRVLVVDDIYDTGQTLSAICNALQKQSPASLQSLVLLKKKRPPSGSVNPDFVCFDIEDHFVVGYGLDYKELHRGLTGIYRITP